MIIFKKAHDLREYLEHRPEGVGFIPTMGALHSGHVSLIAQAKADGHLTVCSIFVNPTQFNDRSDFDKYPISIEADIELLLSANCDILFLPDESQIYPHGTVMATAYHFGYLETVLEGAQRPGHFRGVGQVVARLLEIVQPQFLYLGQKDYQQCLVIKELLRITGRDSMQLIICPTLREPDGLAMSSRNRRLTEPQRSLAGIIYQCLISIQSKQESGTSFSIVAKECYDLMIAKGLAPEYISLADATTLELLPDYDEQRQMVALIALKLGDIRLIDNMLLNDAQYQNW